MRLYQKIPLQRCTLTIVLSLLLGSITVPCATVNPASYYQRSNDGSYRYAYNAGDGFNARQSANAANEVVGQYTQLQPDGRIDNVRYKAGVGGFRPQYGAAYSPYNGADSGQRARQYAGYGVYGGGSGPFGTRSLNGGSQFGYGGYYTPGFHNNAQSYGGLGGESYDARSLGGGSLGGGAVGAGSLGGGLGSRSLGGGYVGNGAGAGAGGLQAGGGLGSNFDGSSLGNHPQGGSPSEPNSSSLGPGSIASRSPIGGSLDAGALNRRTPADGTSALGSTDGIGSSTGSNPFGTNAFGRSPQQIGSVYGGIPSYATNPALGRTFGYPRIPLAFVYTTPRSFIAPSVTSTPINGVGTNRFPNNDGRSTTRGNQFQDDAGIRDLGAAGPNTGYRPTGGNAATTPNGLPNQIASSSQNSRPGSQTNPQNDGTYNFAYRTPDSTRQESADGQGNVHGSYAFRNANGNHDLSFVAGPNTGFQPTGGSLAVPNGLGQGRSNVNGSPVSPVASTAVRNDNNGGNGLGDPSRHGSGIGQNNNGAQNSGSNGEALNGGRSGNDQRLLSDGTGSGSAIGGNLGAGGPNVFQQTGLRGLDGNLGSSGSTGNHGNGLANTGFGGNGGCCDPSVLQRSLDIYTSRTHCEDEACAHGVQIYRV